MILEYTFRIKPEYIPTIRKNKRLMARLQLTFNKSHDSIYRWLRDGNVMLTTPQAIYAIEAETGLKEDEVLERIKLK